MFVAEVSIVFQLWNMNVTPCIGHVWAIAVLCHCSILQFRNFTISWFSGPSFLDPKGCPLIPSPLLGAIILDESSGSRGQTLVVNDVATLSDRHIQKRAETSETDARPQSYVTESTAGT